MSDFVPKALEKAAELYRQRNALYGDNYKNFGKVMLALFPDGVYHSPNPQSHEEINRYCVLVQIVSKLTRYCANFEHGGHADSLEDLAVYAMMLNELDESARLEKACYAGQNTTQISGGIDPE